MILKMVYIIIVFAICLIIYSKIKDKKHSIIYIIVTGLIGAITSSFFIPADISVFNVFGAKNSISDKNMTATNTTVLPNLGCKEIQYISDEEKEYITDELLRICANQPQSLVAILSMFPHALEAVDIQETDPLAIETLLLEEGGGEMQKEMLAALYVLLRSKTTECAYGIFNGTALSLGTFIKDESKEVTLENVYLDWTPLNLDNATEFIVIAHYNEDEYEMGIFDLQTGFMPIVEFHPYSSN